MENFHGCISILLFHQNHCTMKINPILRSVFIATIIGINLYAIIQGITYKSYWGITLAIASLGALLLSIKLLKKLDEIEKEYE